MIKKTTSANCLARIRSFEGLKLTSYQDQVGVWTIGYGYTSEVKQGQTITFFEAERQLEAKCADIAVALSVAIHVPVSQNQFDALVSFCYNLGVGSLTHGGPDRTPSQLLKHLNAGEFMAAGAEFIKWDHAGGVEVAGLTRRRMDERDLFMRPDVISS